MTRRQTFHHVHVTAPDGARGIAAAAAELELIGHLPVDATLDVQSVHSCSPRFTGEPVRYHALIAVWSSELVETRTIDAHIGCDACSHCGVNYDGRCSSHPAFDADYCPSCGTAAQIGGQR